MNPKSLVKSVFEKIIEKYSENDLYRFPFVTNEILSNECPDLPVTYKNILKYAIRHRLLFTILEGLGSKYDEKTDQWTSVESVDDVESFYRQLVNKTANETETLPNEVWVVFQGMLDAYEINHPNLYFSNANYSVDSAVSSNGSNASGNTKPIIDRHSFEQHLKNINGYLENADSGVDLSDCAVEFDGGILGLVDHRVTGREFNYSLGIIQDNFRELSSNYMNLVSELGEVYHAFDTLDKDYISGIVASLKAAEKAIKEEENDRKQIKLTLGLLERTVDGLKKFKESSKQQFEAVDKRIADQSAALSEVRQANQKDLGLLAEEIGEQKKTVDYYLKQEWSRQSEYAADDLMTGSKIIEGGQIQKKLDELIQALEVIEQFKTSSEQRYDLFDNSIGEQKETTDKCLNEIQNLKSGYESVNGTAGSLAEKLGSLAEKLKKAKQRLTFLWICAGSAAGVAVAHLILDILGIL